ncbi:MAG: hypothetical protein ABIP94_11770 [Planctomycetota bacterium]
MSNLEVLGWWFHERAPDGYPRPQRLVSPWDPGERAAVLDYLRAGKTLVSYPTSSYCRFACGERDLGHRDLTDGTFVWPDGLSHYINRHEVRLPPRFVAHVLSRNAVIAPFEPPEPCFGLFDKAPWLAWARAEGACLDLAGWEVPTRDAARRITAELRTVDHDFLALCRGDTRQVVLGFDDGSLDVRQLTANGHAPRHLAGWHVWPVLS